MSRAGIYRIVNTINGKQYIGSTVDVPRRLREHARALRRNAHHSDHLQRAWDKYGESAFVFEPLWSVEPVEECLLYEEQLAFNYLPTEYNGTKIASSRFGLMPETRAKIAASHKGLRPTADTRARMAASQKRRAAAPEERARLSAIRKAAPVSEATRRKLTEANRGRVKSKSEREKLSAAQKKKPVVGTSTTGSTVTFSSVCEAARALSGAQANISACLKGRRRTAYGYRWRPATEEDLQAFRSAAMAM